MSATQDGGAGDFVAVLDGAQDRAEHAAACIRALSGIADPEGFVQDVAKVMGMPLPGAPYYGSDAYLRVRSALLARKAGR
jgi:hypothetical protein